MIADHMEVGHIERRYYSRCCLSAFSGAKQRRQWPAADRTLLGHIAVWYSSTPLHLGIRLGATPGADRKRPLDSAVSGARPVRKARGSLCNAAALIELAAAVITRALTS